MLINGSLFETKSLKLDSGRWNSLLNNEITNKIKEVNFYRLDAAKNNDGGENW